MDITLKPEQVEFIRTRLASGRYRDADEVVEEALKLLEQHLEILKYQEHQLKQLLQDERNP